MFFYYFVSLKSTYKVNNHSNEIIKSCFIPFNFISFADNFLYLYRVAKKPVFILTPGIFQFRQKKIPENFYCWRNFEKKA